MRGSDDTLFADRVPINRDDRKPFCKRCESESGFLFYNAERRGRRLIGAEIVRAEKRYAVRCGCGGVYRHPRTEEHFTLGSVFKIFSERQGTKAKGVEPPPLSEIE